MRRREFVQAILGLAAAWPLKANAQTAKKKPLIVWFSGGIRDSSMGFARLFLQGMQDLDYTENVDFSMAYRFSEGFQDRLPALADEVVKLNPNIILATAVVTAVVAQRATSTIPIVCPVLADAAHLGLITSERRPSGNITGIEPYVPGLPAKQMELARQIMPAAKKVGLLTDLKDPKAPPQLQEQETAGRAMGLEITSAGARDPDDLESALQALADQRADIVIVLQSTMLISERQRIAESALLRRLPTVYGYREHVLVGGLISYGVDLRWCYRRGAYFVDKILHGATPGDLPVEFPTKLVLSINLKTANALGLKVPPSLLATADEVIE